MYKKFLLFVLFTVIFTGWHNSVLADFIQYSNESSWQVAAGATVLEDFESYSVGDTFSSLPALGVGFSELSGGGFPNIYRNYGDVTPYGRNHLGNFPNGTNSINRWADTTMFVLSGYNITAVGFWNGDGQADTFLHQPTMLMEFIWATLAPLKVHLPVSSQMSQSLM